MARRQRFYICVGTEPTQDRIERSSRLIVWHGIVKRLRRSDATKEPTIQWQRVIVRPCHDIRYGAQKEPAYRVIMPMARLLERNMRAREHGRPSFGVAAEFRKHV